MNFKVKLFGNDENLMPIRKHEDDAGFDIKAREVTIIDSPKHVGWQVRGLKYRPVELLPGERCLVKTGVFLELTPGWEAQVRCRSGIACSSGIMVTNGVGTIDAGYRDEVGVILTNTGTEVFKIYEYDRVAQLVFKEVPKIELTVVKEDLNETDRGQGGFGSTGVKN